MYQIALFVVRKKSKFIINQEASGLLSRLGIRTPKLINYGLIKEKNYNSLIQKWLDDNNILIYSTHNKGKSVVAERFIRTLKGKIYRKMTGNDSQSYLGYLSKLLDEYNNNYRYFTVIDLLMLIILLWLKKLSRVIKLLNLKLVIESELLSTEIFLGKFTPKIGQEKYLLLIVC